MSEQVYLLLALSLVVSYLLLTAGGGSLVSRSRPEEIERLADATEQAMERNFERGTRLIDEAQERRRS
jgi:hypothetical protein